MGCNSNRKYRALVKLLSRPMSCVLLKLSYHVVNGRHG